MFRDTLEGSDRGSMEMHLDAAIVRGLRYICRPWSSEIGEALRGHDRASFVMPLEAVTQRDWRHVIGIYDHANLVAVIE
jgi:hypothetical protein